MQEIRERFHAAVRELAGEDGIARVRERGKNDGHRVLRAARHENPLRARIDSGSGEERRAGLTLPARTVVGLIVEDRPWIALRKDARHARRERPSFRVRQKAVGRQVDGGRLGLRASKVERLLTSDERPPADFPAHEPAPLGLGVRARHRREGYFQLVGEIALGREPRAFFQSAARDVLGDRVGNGQVERDLGVSNRWTPHCHACTVTFAHPPLNTAGRFFTQSHT